MTGAGGAPTNNIPNNIHATAIVVGERGLLITGPSGAGKTTLALALIDHFCRRGKFSRLVGDDQLFVEAHGGRLVCRAPCAIAGLVEVPGLGPRATPFEPGAVIDLCVRLALADDVQRFQDEAMQPIAGCDIPVITVAERNVIAALPAVEARLADMRFRPI